jgi:glycerate 2-kinase
MLNAKALLRSLFDTAVAAATPTNCMKHWLPRRPTGQIVVVGAGKAAAAMARQLEDQWGAPLRGVVVVPPGHDEECRFVKVRFAAHPVPDESCVAASKAILEAVSGLSEEDTVICLLSGGGSSLLTLPLPGIALSDKQRITQALLRSGAAIHEINCVRKQLSAIKGGKLAAACEPANVITLVISDVQGNDVAVVASGPTAASSATVDDAVSILDRYGISVSNSIIEAMRAGAARTEGTLEADIRLLASSDDALQAAALAAMETGVTPYMLGDLGDDARDLACEHAELALKIAAGDGPVEPPCVILSGGETTVPVLGGGRGGRNGEYALALAIALHGHPAIHALAADTDGIDGSGDNAGCFVTPETITLARAAAIEALDCQRNNDSYAFFEATGGLLKTGPTRTNVNDFRAILITKIAETREQQ